MAAWKIGFIGLGVDEFRVCMGWRRRDVAMEELFFDFEDLDDSWLVLSMNEAVLRAKGVAIEAVIHLFFLVRRHIVLVRRKRLKWRAA